MKSLCFVFLVLITSSFQLNGQCGDECTESVLTFYTGTSPDGALFFDDCQSYSCNSEDLSEENFINPCGFENLPTFWVDVYPDNKARMLYVEVTKDNFPANVSIAIYEGDCVNKNILSFNLLGKTISCSQDDGAFNRIHIPIPENNNGIYHVAIGILDYKPDDSLKVCVGTTSITNFCGFDAEPLGSNYECESKTDFSVSERSFTDLIDSDGDGLPGPFCPNEEIRVWTTYEYNSENTGNGWLQAIIPMMNDNFLPINPDGVEFNYPGAHWFEEGIPIATDAISRLCTYTDRYGILQLCNDLCESCPCFGPVLSGSNLPGGWFWTSPGGSGCANDGLPYSMYGIPQGNNVVFDFYIDVTVREFSDIINCPTNKNLKFGFQPLTDGLTGCWEDPTGECNILPAQTIQYEIDCNLPNSPMISTLAQNINSRDSVDVYIEAPLPYLFVEIVPIENANIEGAQEHYKEGSLDLNDKLINLTDEIQIQQYIVRTRDDDVVCPSLQDTVRIEIGKNEGVEKVQYQIRYNAEYNWYDCYLIIKEGFANTPATLTQFSSQYTIAMNTGRAVEIVNNYNPVKGVDNIPVNWNISTSVKSPSAAPDFDYYAISPKLSPTGYYPELNEGDTIKLFSLMVVLGPDCIVPIRLYENGVDPGPGAPGMGGGDFSQQFTIGGFIDKYDSNLSADVPQGNVPVANLDDDFIYVGSNAQLTPKSGGTWTSNDDVIGTVNNAGLVTGVSAGCAEFIYTELVSGCQTDPIEVCFANCPGVDAVQFQIRYAAEYDWYDCYLVVKEGCANLPNQLVQFNTNYSLVLPTGVSYSIDSLYAPIRSDNGQPMNWTRNEQVISPAAQPQNDFHTIIPELSPLAYYDSPLSEGDTVKLFSVSLSPNNSCLDHIRLFENGVDPSSSAPGMNSADYSQGFTIGGFVQQYDSNLPGLDIQNNRPMVSITGDTIISLGQTGLLSPNTGGTWSSANISVATVTDGGIVTGVGEGCTTFQFTESTNGCQSTTGIICIVRDSFPQFLDNELCLGESTFITPYENYTFEVDPPNIISIDNDGVVTTLNPGNATIQVSGPNAYSSILGITVYDLPNVTFGPYGPYCLDDSSVQLQGTPLGGTFSGVAINGSEFDPTSAGVGVHQITYEYTNGNGCTNTATTDITVLDLPITSILGNDTIGFLGTTQVSPSIGGTWVSSNPVVLTVTNEGIVTGLSTGCALLVFTSSTTQCHGQALTICVVQDSIPQLEDDKLCVGEMTQILYPENHFFTSNSPTIVSVNSDGKVTALSAGIAQITVEGVNGSVDVLTIKVNPIPVATLLGPDTIGIAGITTVSPSTGGTWSSSDNNIVTVTDAGLVTGVALGCAVVVFTDVENECSSNPITICVDQIDVPYLDKEEICIGDNAQIINYDDYDFNVLSSNILTLSNGGLITGTNSGTAEIEVTGAGGYSDVLTIVVNASPVITLTGPDSILVGNNTSFTPTSGGTWASNNISVATISNSGLVTGVAVGTVTLDFTDYNGCRATSEVITVYELDSPILCGTAYMDDNENDTFDIGELTLSNFKIIDPSNNMSYFTDANGQYSFDVQEGVQEVTVEATYGLWKNPILNESITISEEKTIQNFGFVVEEIMNDASVTMTSGILRCNTFAELTVAATNKGTSTLNGTLTVELDPTISYTEFNPEPISQVGSSYVFEYSNLKPGNCFTPYIRIGVPPFFPSQDSLKFSALMKDDMGNDLVQKDYVDVIRCSHDPNDKRVFPDRPGEENHILAGETVEYIIRFQNNGNDTAFYVEVVDVISNTLDINSLRVMESSHDMTTEIHMDTVFFKFRNILLVDSMTNYEASQGFVAFSIKAMVDLEPKDVVSNTADIIFDKNDAIITNTITNTVIDILPCYDLSSDITRVENTLYGAANGSEYIWIDCEDLDTIFTSTVNEFTPAYSGLYQLILKGEACQNISDCYSFIISDIANIDNIEVTLYPNPTDGLVYIKSQVAPSKVSILRTDGSFAAQFNQVESIDMSSYPAGVYTIRLEIDNIFYHRLILVE